jgi:hypothetical protein
MRERPLEHNQFKVTFDSSGQTFEIALTRGGAELASIELNVNEASIIAAIILGAAQKAHLRSGRQNADIYDDRLAVITPSGLNVGPGRKSENLIAAFFFGDSGLGIELPKENARILGQRLLTSAADEGVPQWWTGICSLREGRQKFAWRVKARTQGRAIK